MSFMHQEVKPRDFYEAWNEIEKMRYYFYKFAGPNAEEAMENTLMHVLTHFDSSKGYLPDYVRKLARTIEKKNNRLVLVDFLEETVSEDDTEEVSTGYNGVKRSQDVADEAIENIMQNENYFKDVEKLALEFMDKFVILAKALMQHDTNTTYYPEPFIKACMDLMHKYSNFNQACIDIYRDNIEDFQWFLELEKQTDVDWRETDYLLFAQRESKRVLLVNRKTKESVKDCEKEPFLVKGNLGTKTNPKYVLKVDFSKAWHTMCDLIDDLYSNEMKFVLGDNYIVRTLGGSYSVVNPIKTNMYGLVRDEILTNVLLMFNCRILSVGKTTAYVLANDLDICQNYVFTIKGVTVDFTISQVPNLTRIQ